MFVRIYSWHKVRWNIIEPTCATDADLARNRQLQILRLYKTTSLATPTIYFSHCRMSAIVVIEISLLNASSSTTRIARRYDWSPHYHIKPQIPH